MSPSHTHKGFRATIQAALHHRNGKTTVLPETPANSLIMAFIKVLKVAMSTLSETVTDVTGVDRVVVVASQLLNCAAGNTITTWGLVIGTGTDPVLMVDTKLQTQVSANIAHSVTAFSLDAPDASTFVLAISRAFTNNTGAVLSIREVALYNVINLTGTQYACTDRTLYFVDVPAGMAITLTYRIYISL